MDSNTNDTTARSAVVGASSTLNPNEDTANDLQVHRSHEEEPYFFNPQHCNFSSDFVHSFYRDQIPDPSNPIRCSRSNHVHRFR